MELTRGLTRELIRSLRLGGRQHLACLAGCLLAAFSHSSAQNQITRDQAISASIGTVGVQVAQARVGIAEAQAQAANIPISGSANVSYGWTGLDPKPNDTDAPKGDWAYGAQINFAGLFGEANSTRVQASLNLERARLNLSSSVLRANKSAITLWHNLRRGTAAMSTAQAARALAQLQDNAAETRLQNGAINISERETVRIALQSAQLEESRSQFKLEAARTQLAIVFNLSGNVAGDWRALPVPSENANLERREDVFESRAILVNAELELARAQRAALPTLNLDAGLRGSSGNLGFKLNSDLSSSLGFGYPNSNTIPDATTWNLALSMNIPIDPIKLSALPALERNLQTARASLEASILAAKADVAAKRAVLALTKATLNLFEQQLEQNQSNLERNRQRFAAGLIAALELNRSELELQKAGDALLNAQAEVDSGVLDVFEAINLPVINAMEAK